MSIEFNSLVRANREAQVENAVWLNGFNKILKTLQMPCGIDRVPIPAKSEVLQCVETRQRARFDGESSHNILLSERNVFACAWGGPYVQDFDRNKRCDVGHKAGNA